MPTRLLIGAFNDAQQEEGWKWGAGGNLGISAWACKACFMTLHVSEQERGREGRWENGVTN